MKIALKAPQHRVATTEYTSGGTPPPDFWEPHPEVIRGPVGWQLTRMYGPRSLAQLDRMQRIQQGLSKGLAPVA